jgi:hypothetical protein
MIQLWDYNLKDARKKIIIRQQNLLKSLLVVMIQRNRQNFTYRFVQRSMKDFFIFPRTLIMVLWALKFFRLWVS